MRLFLLVPTHDLLEDRRRTDVIIKILIIYYVKQIDSMLPCVCSVIDHRWSQNVVRTSVTHSGYSLVCHFFVFNHILTEKMNEYVIDHSPRGFSGSMYNTLWGTLPDCYYALSRSRAVFNQLTE